MPRSPSVIMHDPASNSATVTELKADIKQHMLQLSRAEQAREAAEREYVKAYKAHTAAIERLEAEVRKLEDG